MAALSDWLLHRQQVLGLDSSESLSDASGISAATLDAIVARGTLAGVGRSLRGALARALKVTVRDLEALDEGLVEWIADGRVIDLDSLAPSHMRLAVSAPTPIDCLDSRGV